VASAGGSPDAEHGTASADLLGGRVRAILAERKVAVRLISHLAGGTAEAGVLASTEILRLGEWTSAWAEWAVKDTNGHGPYRP
jgi:hypothetical protein